MEFLKYLTNVARFVDNGIYFILFIFLAHQHKAAGVKIES